MYESTFSTLDIHGQVVSVEEVKHNGHLILKCGDIRQKYIGYTLEEARYLFSDLLRRKNLI